MAIFETWQSKNMRFLDEFTEFRKNITTINVIKLLISHKYCSHAHQWINFLCLKQGVTKEKSYLYAIY